LLIRNAYFIKIAILENHNKTNISTQITRFNPKRLLELKHIFVLLLSRLYAFTTHAQWATPGYEDRQDADKKINNVRKQHPNNKNYIVA
jgi:hypothetical protein